MPVSPERVRSAMRGYALALLAAACWATGGLTAKWLFTAPSAASDTWPIPPLGIVIEPTALSGARAVAATLLLLVFLSFGRREALKVSPRDLPFLVTFGVLGLAAVHYTYFKTISLTDVATAILLEYLAPVIVLVVSVAFLKHRFTWSLPVGVVLSIVGCALVVGVAGGEMSVSPQGVAWGLASAVFFSVYSLMGSIAAHRWNPFTTLFYGLASASVFWLLVLGPGTVLSVFRTGQSALAVVFMAIVSTVIPFAAFLSALHHIAPTNATITSTVEPVLAGLGAFALFGETLTAMQLVGGAMVVSAILVVQWSDRTARQANEVFPPQD